MHPEDQQHPEYPGPRQAAPYPPHQPPTGPPAPRKKRGWLVGLIVAIVAVCGIGAVAALATDNSDPATPADDGEVAQPAVDEEQPEPEAAPEPDGTVEGNCDLLLFTGPNDQSEFAASIDVTNTGNVGIKVRVTAAFDQLGQDDHVLSKTVKVGVGEAKTVNLSEYIDGPTVDRHQNGGYECRVDGEITGTFGES